MTTAAALALTDQWTTYAQSLRLWVLDFLVWLAGVTRWRELRLHAQSELRFLRREVRAILLARMAIEICAAPLVHRKRRAHVRERCVSRRRFHRYVLRGVTLRTVAEAKHVLEHLEAHVARCIANYRTGMKRPPRHDVDVTDSVHARVSEGADAPDTS